MKNIEIKSPLADRASVEQRLCEHGAQCTDEFRQRDTFFAVPEGAWLKLREIEGRGAELISYRRATEKTGPRASDYDVAPLTDVEQWHRLLGRALAVDGVVEKTRSLWLWDHTRVHLDRVEGLGEFLELETVLDGIDEETGQAECARIVALLDLDTSQFLAVPYRDLLRHRAEPDSSAD